MCLFHEFCLNGYLSEEDCVFKMNLVLHGKNFEMRLILFKKKQVNTSHRLCFHNGHKVLFFYM